jgi:hypothetical protein
LRLSFKKEDSSFSEEKEAKRLYFCAASTIEAMAGILPQRQK